MIIINEHEFRRKKIRGKRRENRQSCRLFVMFAISIFYIFYIFVYIAFEHVLC